MKSTVWKIFDVLWSALIFVGLTLAVIYLPLRLITSFERTWLSMNVSWMISVLFTFDIFYNLHTVYREHTGQRTVHERLQLYLRRRLWVDVLAALPIQFFLGVSHPLILVRLFKLVRIRDMMNRWRHVTMQFATILRLVVLIYALGLAAHWIACGWIALRPMATHAAAHETFNDYYIRALYWAITTLSTVGYGDVTPQTSIERLYSMAVMVMGVVVYGYVVGNIANLLNNLDLPRKHYFERSDQMRAFMQYHKIPRPLQRRISEYYSYYWAKQLGYDVTAVLADLPPSLKSEVMVFLRRDIIAKVPLFQDTSEEFIKDIAQQIRPILFLPGDIVMRAGEVARDMYFVSRGTVEIMADDGRILAVLSDGDFFGEVALLLHKPRSATVRAIDYCDLYILEKEAFHNVLARHPEFAGYIERKVIEVQEKNAL